MITIILSLSILLQFSAAFYALWLIRITGLRSSWIFISFALILMGTRRCVPLYHLLNGGRFSSDIFSESIGLAISVFMLLGVRMISPLFKELKLAELNARKQLSRKEILLKDVHHRIKNNITTVESFLTLQAQTIENPEAISILQNGIGRVQSMRVIYDKLLLTSEYGTISVKNYMEDLIFAIFNIFTDNDSIRMELKIEDFQLETNRLFPLGTIINELLTNTMKYAFINKKTGLVQITLSLKGNHAELILQDDGDGLPENFSLDSSKGFGLMIIQMFSEQLGGTFTIEKNNGTRNTLKFHI